MNYLLDTQAFIWWDNDQKQLSAKVLALCEDSRNTLFLSAASVWEMQIKIHIGKLKLPLPLKDTVQAQRKNNHIRLLPIKLPHIYQTPLLPNHHKDPFDRLIVAQAVIERLSIITSDKQIAQYPVTVVW